MSEEMIDLAVSKHDVTTMLDALEARIDYINEFGTPADWKAGAEAYELNTRMSMVYRTFADIAKQQVEEDEG